MWIMKTSLNIHLILFDYIFDIVKNWSSILKMHLISCLDISNGFSLKYTKELVQVSKLILKIKSNGHFFNVIFAQHGVNSTYKHCFSK
jgi:hypothetical protein